MGVNTMVMILMTKTENDEDNTNKKNLASCLKTEAH